MCITVITCYLTLLAIPTIGGVKLNDGSDQHDFLVVSLDGKTVDQFTTVQLAFQEFIATLAIDFCKENGFQNYGTINSTTIEIHDVEGCPVEWPDSELCINVNFSVPINYTGSYQLSNRNLFNMWRTHSPYELKQLGVKEYEIPSNSTILILWLCVTGLLFILFLVILVVVLKTKCIENYIRSRRDMLGSSNRSWISQHGGKQLVPPFFYPEAPSTKHIGAHIQYDSEGNMQQQSFGIVNPGYNPDLHVNKLEKQISQTTTIVDDFDSDDETIYPPSPLSRPASQRNDKGNAVAVSRVEYETTF